MEFSLHALWGEFSDNCPFKNMCREEHYYMTLPNETPPPSFPKYVFFFFRDSYFTKQLAATASNKAKFV